VISIFYSNIIGLVLVLLDLLYDRLGTINRTLKKLFLR